MKIINYQTGVDPATFQPTVTVTLQMSIELMQDLTFCSNEQKALLIGQDFIKEMKKNTPK